jgi:hypothetical protein
MKRKFAFETAKSGWREPYAQGTILAVAAAVVVVWVLTKPIVFTQDTITYINAARELRLGQSAGDIFSRLPAFPAVLAAFHITDLKHTVFWLVVFQACLAVGSCWLFYLTARLLSPRVGAFVLSLIFIASLLPFVQVKHIMTEQTFFFETMLTAFGMVAYLLARTMRGAWFSLAVLGVGTTLMTLTRPQGAYVVPVVFGLVGVLAWRRAALAIVGAIMVLGAVWSIQILDHRARSMSQMSAGSLDSSHMTGKMFFFTFYLDGSSRANIRIAPENGPKTAELKALLLDEYAKPDTLARRKGYLVSVPPQDVPAYVERIFSEPNSDFFNLLAFASLDDRLGPKEADRLLLQICLEAALAYPVPTARLFIEKGLEIYFNPWMLSVPSHPPFAPGYFQSALADEVAADGDYTTPTRADYAIDQNIRWLMRIAVLVAVITLPFALRYHTWRVTIALLVFGLYLNVAVVVGNSPLFRYAIYAIPVNLLCGYAGAVAVLATLRKRYLKKSVAVNG